MFNHQEIDKTPTVSQIKSIIKYMEDEAKVEFNFGLMMRLTMLEPNEVHLDLNDACGGTTYKIIFNRDGTISSFEYIGSWRS